MRYYKKFQDKNCPKRMVSRINFENDDMKEERWHRIGTDGKIRNFAICSACNNPVQLIGLYEPLKVARHPYGKHTGKRIEGFPYFSPDDYLACPYYSRNRTPPFTYLFFSFFCLSIHVLVQPPVFQTGVL